MAYLRVVELEQDPLPGSFDFAHLRRVHGYLLQDVYEWAGEVRTSDTTAMGIAHCRPAYIEDQAAHIFRRIARNFPSKRDRADAIDAVADYWGELTALHPFRDGNSRSQRVFFDSMFREAGWAVDWRRVDAAAVHAARHVAMATADHSYLAGQLTPAV